MNCPPSVGSPRFARGTAWGAWVLPLRGGNRAGVRFPLLVGGTAHLATWLAEDRIGTATQLQQALATQLQVHPSTLTRPLERMG